MQRLGFPLSENGLDPADALHVDFENSRAQGDEIEERLCAFLGLSITRDFLTRWHESDCAGRSSGTAGYTLDDIIKDWATASQNPRKLVERLTPDRYWRTRRLKMPSCPTTNCKPFAASLGSTGRPILGISPLPGEGEPTGKEGQRFP